MTIFNSFILAGLSILTISMTACKSSKSDQAKTANTPVVDTQIQELSLDLNNSIAKSFDVVISPVNVGINEKKVHFTAPSTGYLNLRKMTNLQSQTCSNSSLSTSQTQLIYALWNESSQNFSNPAMLYKNEYYGFDQIYLKSGDSLLITVQFQSSAACAVSTLSLYASFYVTQ